MWTQLELEERIALGDERLANARSLVMIQCVGCRQEGRNYCSRICCGQALKNALTLKKQRPELDITILFRDIRTYGFKEDYYREAADKYVNFIRWEPEDGPEVQAATDNEGRSVLQVTVPDPILGQRLSLDADLLILSAALIPSSGSLEAARLFKVAASPDGFFQEAHVKLRPVDFAADGVFQCGAAHYPKHLTEAVAQAYGAAGRAVALLARDTVTASGSVCRVKAGGVRLVRRLHRGLHVWCDRVLGDAGRQEGGGQFRTVQGRWPVQRCVPDNGDFAEALHRRGAFQPDRRGHGESIKANVSKAKTPRIPRISADFTLLNLSNPCNPWRF